MIRKTKAKLFWGIIAWVLIMAGTCGCGSRPAEQKKGQDRIEAEAMIRNYIADYGKQDYRKMWDRWPEEAFRAEKDVLADMRTDIFRNSYGKKTRLTMEYGEIVKGNAEDRKRIVRFFKDAGISYVTNVWMTEYKAVVAGGKRDGEIYKEGIICAFRNNGRWHAYDY